MGSRNLVIGLVSSVVVVAAALGILFLVESDSDGDALSSRVGTPVAAGQQVEALRDALG